MKVLNIKILPCLEEINIENGQVHVFITTDDGFTYNLTFATHEDCTSALEYEIGQPKVLMNPLTKEGIEKAAKNLAELDDGYFLRLYDFEHWIDP